MNYVKSTLGYLRSPPSEGQRFVGLAAQREASVSLKSRLASALGISYLVVARTVSTSNHYRFKLQDGGILMRQNVTFLIVLGFAALAFSGYAVVPNDTVMGNWEGQWYDESFGGGTLSVQVIAEGKGNYRAIISADIGEVEPIRGEARGKREGDEVSFKGKIEAGPDYGGVHELTGKVSDGKFTGQYAGENRGRFDAKRVRKVSPTIGAKPPEGAVILFDGKDKSKWFGKNDTPNPWKLVDGAMEVVSGKGSIYTKQHFRDFKLHLEFCLDFMPTARGQGRCNSGVYLPGGNEIQVLDSFGLKPSRHDCGAFYGQAAPLVNACLPPGEWQTYDVTFIAPRFDDKGERVKNAIITVFHNGIKTHDQFRPRREGVPSGGIQLQDHDNRLWYRNIWLVPLRED